MSRHERLRLARTKAGYTEASLAAEAMGVAKATYTHHENGHRDFAKRADQYARFFRVSLDWLMTGKGEMRAGRRAAVPIMGYVGAGATIDPIANRADAEFPDDVEMPVGAGVAALIVRGPSQYPRFMDGEIILYEIQPVSLEDVIDQYAIVTTMDGRVLIKIVRTAGRPGRWRLESHNAPPEEVDLLGAQRYLGTLATGQSRPALALSPRRRKT